MQFEVPQFIEVEAKIFGPLTIKQFIYVAGGAGLAFIIYYLLGSFWLALPLAVPILILAAALAFYKVNDKPFINIMESAFKYFFSNKLYIWHKADKPIKANSQEEIEKLANPLGVPKLSNSRLRDLTWSLDITENLNPVTRDNTENKLK